MQQLQNHFDKMNQNRKLEQKYNPLLRMQCLLLNATKNKCNQISTFPAGFEKIVITTQNLNGK